MRFGEPNIKGGEKTEKQDKEVVYELMQEIIDAKEKLDDFLDQI